MTVKKIANCNNINSVNPLNLIINEMIGHFEEKEVQTINGDEKMEYGRDFKTIRFESNDYLSMNKPINLRLLTIIIRSVFSKDGKFYPQLFLDDALDDFLKCCSTKKLMFQKELM